LSTERIEWAFQLKQQKTVDIYSLTFTRSHRIINDIIGRL
jgi:hypothetical protein